MSSTSSLTPQEKRLRTLAQRHRAQQLNRVLAAGVLLLILWPGLLRSPSPSWKELRDPSAPTPPPTTSPFKGTEQRLRVIIAQEERINAIKLEWRFDPEALEVLGIDSYINPFYIVPPGGLFVDNTVGVVRIAGALPPPGWIGREVIAYIDVRGHKRGAYELALQQDFSVFFRKDGLATIVPAQVEPLVVEFR